MESMFFTRFSSQHEGVLACSMDESSKKLFSVVVSNCCINPEQINKWGGRPPIELMNILLLVRSAQFVTLEQPAKRQTGIALEARVESLIIVEKADKTRKMSNSTDVGKVALSCRLDLKFIPFLTFFFLGVLYLCFRHLSGDVFRTFVFPSVHNFCLIIPKLVKIYFIRR